MNKLMLVIIIVAFLPLILPVQATIYVGGKGGVATISEAIEEANENETVIVYEGIYNENVVIDKPLILKALGNVTIEGVDSKNEVVRLNANNAVFSGFYVKGGYAGIYLDNVQGCKIENNSVFENEFGIALRNSSSNSVLNNAAFKNEVVGIHLEISSSYNIIKNNTIHENGERGINLRESAHNNEISSNIVNHNSFGIVLLQYSFKNEVSNNTVCDNEEGGILLKDSMENEVVSNLLNNNFYGIGLIKSINSCIKNNTACNNGDGIHLKDSSKNEIRYNTALENDGDGIHLVDSFENEVCNNLINKNYRDGIISQTSNKNKITNNTACENRDDGISLEISSETEIRNNFVNKNLNGIVVVWSNNVIIENNTACENRNIGINIDNSTENEVSNNLVNKNTDGIGLTGSSNNQLENNTAWENGRKGMFLADSPDNEINSNIANRNLLGISIFASNSNKIKDNTACENDDGGMYIGQDSSKNVICNNIFKKNLNGIALIRSNTNEITNNIADENRNAGVHLQDSSWNAIINNSFNKSLKGISLNLGSHYNIVTNNNIINSKYRQVVIENSFLNEFNHNYWTDYEGEDENNDGFGEESYAIDEANKDDYPYMSYSGWLNVVVRPEYWYFFAKKGDVINNTFCIENRLNRATQIEILLAENLEFETGSGGNGINKTITIKPKSTQNITVQMNTTNLDGYILRKIIFKTEDYTKTTLVNGFVQPKIFEVKIEGVYFHRNVVQGQMNPFYVHLRNFGDTDKFNVTLKMGSEIQRSVYLNENETKTVLFEIDTSDMPLDINKGQVIISKDERLDYLNLTMFVASKREASTLIVTNHKRMRDKWGDDTVSASELKAKLIELCFHPAVNGIIVSVEHETTCSNLYDEWDIDKAPEKANEIAKAIKSVINLKFEEYPSIEYLVIVGDDRIIPFYRVHDNTDKPFVSGSWTTTRDYDRVNVESTVGSALHHNMFLTDNYYATDKPIEWKTNEVFIPELLIPSMPIGRLVESPEEITAVIDAFFQSETVNPDKVFVTAYDFMCDSALNCSLTLEDKTEGATETVISRKEEVTDESFFNRIWEGLNSSNDVVLIFQHAEHDRFEIPNPREIEAYAYITSQNISTATGLSGSITCSMGCFSGLNVPSNASPEDFDLAQAFAQRGVLAYIAPTSYSIGLFRSIGAHERLICYFTQYLCERMDVGTALTRAKQEYWATNYDISYIDEQVLETTTLYGLPMTRINVPRLNRSYNQSKMEIMSREHTLDEKPDILVISPTHTQINIPFPLYNLTYYKSTSGELLSDPNRPLQPKEIRIFHPTSTRMLHGVVLTSAKYQVKSIIPLVDTYMQSHTKGVFSADEIRDWYPPQIFKLKSLCSPRVPTESRQYLIVITGQYKGATVATPFLEGRKERLYDELSFQLYYASPDEETKPPVINVSHRINHNVTISVNASDESGIQRVLVTYTDGEGEWKSKDLNKTGELWTCAIPINEISEFFVQAVDNNGNVAVGNVFL